MLAVARDHLVTTPAGPRRADVLAARRGLAPGQLRERRQGPPLV